MEQNTHKLTLTIEGKELTFETGRIGRQANGAVLLTQGETMVFSTACASADPVQGISFLPLRVDYQEKFSSAGKTLGGFIKREGRPVEREILVSRMTDRSIRPLFEEGFHNEVQILSYVWSYDGVHAPEPLSICAASAALAISDIPFAKTLAGVRVGMIGERFVVNPTVEEQKESKLDLMLAGTADAVLMIEGFCDFLTEDQILQAIDYGHASIKTICEEIDQWKAKIGKPKKEAILRKLPQELLEGIEKLIKPQLAPALKVIDKQEREKALGAIKSLVEEKYLPEGEEPQFEAGDVSAALKKIQSKYMRQMILDENFRCDGRSPKDVRPISIEPALLPRAHGSALFTRGETQSVSVCTLGGESMAQRFEDLEGDGHRRFYLQYFFPPSSVGEVGRSGPPGRREIGHGKLAERAIQAILPEKENFPYVIRLESNITESNGSSSMASICGGCLALMDAGVPISKPVSGIAMGLILEEGKYTILSDILGIEDALGDMDFKIAGNDQGITTFQMDIKVEGITPEIMKAALEQAKEGRTHILGKMLEALPETRSAMSQYAPRIEMIQVEPSKIGTIIGPGGKQIRAIIEETGVDMDINDDGIVCISSPDAKGIARAKEIVESLTAEAEQGKVYEGTVVSIVKFGCFVEILPGKEGLCHISEFSNSRINDLDEHVKVGDKIQVKLLEINDRGQLKLSRRATLV